MFQRLSVLLTGRSKADLPKLQFLLQSQPGVTLLIRHIDNGHMDPLHGLEVLPDVLILVLSEKWESELAAIRERPLSARPPMLVVGPKDNLDLLRTAMRAGARDYLSTPVELKDLASALHQIAVERLGDPSRTLAHLTVVMNGKGGSGASLIASNLAHVFSFSKGRRPLLVDMDLQFGCLPTYFNVTPRNGLIKALELVETLDAVAIEGYVISHGSGVDILASAAESLVLSEDVEEARVSGLFDVLAQAYDDLVVDIPRHLEAATAVVLDRADQILIVTQQSVAHLRDTRRLLNILEQETGIARDRITVLVNRFDKKGTVTLSDIASALDGVQLETLPNDYRRATESINLGVPLLELGRRTQIAKRFVELAEVVLRPKGGEPGSVAPRGHPFLHWLSS